jgi:hypothetical protein
MIQMGEFVHAAIAAIVSFSLIACGKAPPATKALTAKPGLPDFAVAVLESDVLRGTAVDRLFIGSAGGGRGPLTRATWMAHGTHQGIARFNVSLYVCSDRQEAERVLKQSLIRSRVTFDLEKQMPKLPAGERYRQGDVFRITDPGVAVDVSVDGDGELDAAAIKHARRVADEAAALGDSFKRGQRAKARSIAARVALTASLDPKLDFTSLVVLFRYTTTANASHPKAQPVPSTTTCQWRFTGKDSVPFLEGRLTVFADGNTDDGATAGSPDSWGSSPNESWTFSGRRRNAVLYMRYQFGRFKPAVTEAQFKMQASRTLALAGD